MLSFKKLAIVSGVAFGLIAMAAQAQAATIIDFSTGGTGFTGSFTTDGGGVITGGSNISLGNMTFGGPPTGVIYDTLGSGAESVLDGSLRGVNNGSAVLSFNVASGTFEIDGGIGGLDSSNTASTTVASITPLVTGTLESFSATADAVTFIGGNVVLASTFASAFGVPIQPYTVHFASVIDDSGETDSTDVNISAVPEPGSLLMLGTGLVAVATGLRRRIAKR